MLEPTALAGASEPINVAYVSGGAGLYRREMFLTLGGFWDVLPGPLLGGRGARPAGLAARLALRLPPGRSLRPRQRLDRAPVAESVRARVPHLSERAPDPLGAAARRRRPARLPRRGAAAQPAQALLLPRRAHAARLACRRAPPPPRAAPPAAARCVSPTCRRRWRGRSGERLTPPQPAGAARSRRSTPSPPR